MPLSSTVTCQKVKPYTSPANEPRFGKHVGPGM